MGVLAMNYRAWGGAVMAVVISMYTDLVVQMLSSTGTPIDALFYILAILFLWMSMENLLKQTYSEIADRNKVDRKNLQNVQIVGGGLIPAYYNFQYGDDQLRQEHAGWRNSWTSIIEFVTKILVILTFQYAAKLLRAEWVIIGVTLTESIVLMIILAILFFHIYDEVERSFRAHQKQTMSHSITVAIEKHKLTNHQPKDSSV